MSTSEARKAPLVSIMIISYNQERYIEEAVVSAVQQDYENLEVIVSDDGSMDTTPEILRRLEEKYQPILKCMTFSENVGITKNSNRALRACSGKYIALQGGDDVLLPGKIRKQVAWLEGSEKRVLCGHQTETFYESGFPSHPHNRRLTNGVGPGWIIENGSPFCATSVVLRAASIPHWGFDESLPNVSDSHLYIECLSQGGSFGFVEGTHARYRRHNHNVTNKRAELLCEISLSLDVLAARYPQYIRNFKRARWTFVEYGTGWLFLREGRIAEAFGRFVNTVIRAPLCIKGWIRLAECCLRLVARPFR